MVLLGGRTGRDGCGGATGSSKSHTAHSLETCGAEVQKGNAPEELSLIHIFCQREKGEAREAFEARMLDILRAHDVEMLILAGRCV